MSDRKTYWFPAETYGWGWGFPTTWQGWIVMMVFLVLLVANAIVFPPSLTPITFFAFTAALSVALVGICCIKGEPPRWRSDGKSD